jgi:putative oxidoreductase
MRVVQLIIMIMGRICISALFLLSAINKVIDWQATERGLVSLLCDWHAYVSNYGAIQKFFAAILPWVPAILVVATVLELLGGLLILFGIKPRIGAFLLVIFFVPATILLHQFWFLEGIKRELQMVMFVKNIAILGGLLYILALGTKLPSNSGHSINRQLLMSHHDDDD